MFKTPRRDRRRFQPALESLSLRIAPTVFVPPPMDSSIDVTLPYCGPNGGSPIVQQSPEVIDGEYSLDVTLPTA